MKSLSSYLVGGALRAGVKTISMETPPGVLRRFSSSPPGLRCLIGVRGASDIFKIWFLGLKERCDNSLLFMNFNSIIYHFKFNKLFYLSPSTVEIISISVVIIYNKYIFNVNMKDSFSNSLVRNICTSIASCALSI